MMDTQESREGRAKEHTLFGEDVAEDVQEDFLENFLVSVHKSGYVGTNRYGRDITLEHGTVSIDDDEWNEGLQATENDTDCYVHERHDDEGYAIVNVGALEHLGYDLGLLLETVPVHEEKGKQWVWPGLCGWVFDGS